MIAPDVVRTVRTAGTNVDRFVAESDAMDMLRAEFGEAFEVTDIHYHWLDGQQKWMVTLRALII